MWVIISTVQHIPQVRLVPQNGQAKREVERVEKKPPTIFGELFECRWLFLCFSSSPPPLDVSIGEVKLLREALNLK
jgi:hypothetical protein